MEKLYKKVGGRYKVVEAQRFKIDFIEFSFLVSACIPETPIARAYFWGNVIDKYYYEMTSNERERLFDWINRDWRMEEGIKKGNENCLLFNARFDPSNQYLISTFFAEKEDKIEAFLFEGKYHTSKNKFVNENYITKIEKL